MEIDIKTNYQSKFRIERVKYKADLDQALNQGGLFSLYQMVFSGPPYFESFTLEEISSTFSDYLTKGIVCLAKDGSKVIGFGAAIPLTEDNLVAALFKEKNIDVENTVYMADLGVDPDYRRYGIARGLVLARLALLSNNSSAVMRTSINNIPSQQLYKSLGFKVVPNLVQEVEQIRINGEVSTDRRIFLAKKL